MFLSDSLCGMYVYIIGARAETSCKNGNGIKRRYFVFDAQFTMD
jgi:hypothetical protein